MNNDDVDIIFKRRKGSAAKSEFYSGHATILDHNGILIGIVARTKKDLKAFWKEIEPEHKINFDKVKEVAIFSLNSAIEDL